MRRGLAFEQATERRNITWWIVVPHTGIKVSVVLASPMYETADDNTTYATGPHKNHANVGHVNPPRMDASSSVNLHEMLGF